MKRAILLSLTSTLNAIAAGELTEDDLSQAVFFFRCTKGWAEKTDATEVFAQQRRNFTMHPNFSVETVETARRHILRAAEDGRAAYRKLSDLKPMGQEASQEAMSGLLRKVGLEPLNPNLPPAPTYDNIFFSTAIERVNNKDGLTRVKVLT